MKAIIIDDERLARVELRAMLKQYPEIDVLAEAGNAIEAKASIEKLQPDLIFLDIQMPGKDGFELLEELTILPRVIFVTAYDEYAIKAFEFSALDYLLKPVEPERLANAIEKVTQLIAQANHKNSDTTVDIEKVFLRDGERCWFVELSEISAIESIGNYCRVFFEHNRPLIRRSLSQLEQRLPKQQFFRISRQHIINLKHIVKLENAVNGNLIVTLCNRLSLEMSRRQSQVFRETMSL